MSTPKRKVLYIDGTQVHTEADSIDADMGGLEGEPVMTDTTLGGMSFKQMPGEVTAKVIINGKQDMNWWTPNVKFAVEVDFPDAGTSMIFSSMYQTATFKISGTTAEIKFSGPKGAYAK